MSPTFRPKGRWLLAAAVSCAAILSAQNDPVTDLSPAALEQIRQIYAEKAARTPAQQKLESSLIYAVKSFRNEAIGSNFDRMPGAIEAVEATSGSTKVSVKGTVSADLASAITGLGGQIVFTSDEGYDATLPLTALETLAARSDVQRVSFHKATNNSIRPDNAPSKRSLVQLPMSKQEIDARLAQRFGMPAAVGSYWTTQPYVVGEVAARNLGNLGALFSVFTGAASQGIIAHGAKTVHNTGVIGTGIKVGVLSDSATLARIQALQATGDLPPGMRAIFLPGQAGTGSDEGTAMMEIVYDMAPGVDLVFATAFTSQASFAANIIALAAAGCQVIVDDITYFREGAYQDDNVARAVNQVVAAGVAYFSSAGNSGNTTFGTAGTWEGDYSEVSTTIGVNTINVHRFPSALPYVVQTVAGGPVALKWSDPLAGSANDYDLIATNAAGTAVTGASTGAQNGTQDPFEIIAAPAAGSRLYVRRFSGSAATFIGLWTNRGRLSVNTGGATYGHNAGANTFSSAAVNWNAARRGVRPFVGGPTNPVEVFSSDGFRRVFFNPNGSAITPGCFQVACGGGTLLQKPDAAGADANLTLTPGFNPFYGTSAAAPHLAGIAALMQSARLGAGKALLTPAQVYSIMRSTALDNMAAGVDKDSGSGIVMAIPAVNAAVALP